LSINTFKHKNPSQNQNNLLDATIDATVQLLSRFFGSEKVRVLVAVQQNTAELTLFPTVSAPTKGHIEEPVGDDY
jgi:hypothetical protein